MTLLVAFAFASLAFLPASQDRPSAAIQLQADGLPRAVANDNRALAGRRAGGTLTLRLALRRAVWHLDGDNDPGIPMLAFAEEGEAPRIPGPLLRVPAGTVVDAAVRNTIRGDTLVVFGLTAPGSTDSLVVPPGATSATRFVASREGTYFYWGTTRHSPLRERFGEDSNLSGAFVVDPAGGAKPPADRIFVLTEHGDRESEVPGLRAPLWTAINGKSWPHSERLNGSGTPSFAELRVGRTYRFRFMNIAVSRPAARVQLLRDGRTVMWRAIAKDGWTLDSAQATVRPSIQPLGTGETADVEFAPDRPGDLVVELRAPNGFLFVSGVLRVR